MVFIKMKIILQFYCRENTTDAQQKDRRQLYTDRSFSLLKNRADCIRTILQPFKNRQQLQVFRPGFHSTDQDFGMKSSSYFAIAKRSDMALI